VRPVSPRTKPRERESEGDDDDDEEEEEEEGAGMIGGLNIVAQHPTLGPLVSVDASELP